MTPEPSTGLADESGLVETDEAGFQEHGQKRSLTGPAFVCLSGAALVFSTYQLWDGGVRAAVEPGHALRSMSASCCC